MSGQRTETERSALVLENRHTGEVLNLRRFARGDEVWLEIRGSLPPHSEGPPLHIHFNEDEEGSVLSGVLSAVVDGRRITGRPGDPVSLPRGLAHRWWNDADEPLEFLGYARPVIDFDRYVQAMFDVMNASPAGRPSLFYMAHAALRHRDTQAVLLMPRPIQAIVFRVVVALGTVLGRYRGTDWPGCPSRCLGAPRRDD